MSGFFLRTFVKILFEMATISNNEIKIKYTLDTTDLANATALFDRLSAEDRQLLNDLKRLQAQLAATGQAGQTAGRNIGQGNAAAKGSFNDLQNRVTDLTNRLKNLNPQASNYETILRRLQRAQMNLSIATAQLNNNLGKTKTEFQSLEGPISNIKNLLGGVFSVAAIFSFTKAVIETTVKMQGLQKAIEFTAGSAVGGAADFRFLEKIAYDLGLPLAAAAEGFKTFSAAAARAGITVQEQRKMFTDLSKGMAALQLDAQSAQLVFFGFGQLLSKTKVSAQELYHQIGERMPIAMQAAQIAAARLTGKVKITTAELIDMVEKGKLLSSEFAPEFTKAIGELSKSAAYVETMGKDVNRLTNAWDAFKTSVGDSKVLGAIVGVLDSIVNKLESISEASNYYEQNGLFPEITFKEFKKLEKAAIDTYDNISNTAETRFGSLITINQEYQKTISDDTEAGNLQRIFLETQYNTRRQQVVKDLVDNITREEKNIEDAKKRLTTVGEGDSILGLSRRQKEIKKQATEDLKLAEAAKAAFEKLYGTIPELKTFLPDPDAEKKRSKALEDEYRRLIAQQEALKTAEDDRIKARTREGYTRDIELLKNNVKFNEEMLLIDERADFIKLELAKNNAVKRRGENKRDNQEQLNIRAKALDEALKLEEEYLKKSQDKIDEATYKRRSARQTDLQNELDEIKKNGTEQTDALIIELNKAISIQELSDSKRKELISNYDAQITKIRKDNLNQQLFALKQYYDEQEALDKEAGFDRELIYSRASTRRLAADAKTEYQRQDILDQGTLADINTEKNRLMEQEDRLKKSLVLSTTYKDREIAMIKAKLADLASQEYELQVNAETRKREKMLEIVQASADAMAQIFNDLGNIYIANLDRQKEALGMKYESDVRLADGNKQKLAQLAQEKARAEYEIELKQFKARQIMAVAEVIFKTAPEIAKWISTGVLAPVAAIGLAAQAFAIGAILAQPPPVPPYKDGTKGIPHPGGPAIVGEAGVEKVVTTTGQVYYTPPTATLIDLPKGSQVIPNHALSRKELFWASSMKEGKSSNQSYEIGSKLDKIGGILQTLPIHQINMDERGFEKFVRTERRTTKILNNRFPIR
jgi:tape measure domain-containing protein